MGIRRRGRTDSNRDTAPQHFKCGFVRQIVSQIDGQKGSSQIFHELMQGQALPFHLPRDDFPRAVAMNHTEIGTDAGQELARPDFCAANWLRRSPAKVNPETDAFFFNANPGDLGRQFPDDRPKTWQGFSRSGRQDNSAISFPTIKSQKLDVRDANVLPEDCVPPPAHECHVNARMAVQSAEDPSDWLSQPHIFWSRTNGHQCSVKIKKQTDVLGGANPLLNLLPRLKQMGSTALGLGHGK